jgi:acyl-coenzyme A synthetase/AMP-(fatty) acid ligase
MGDFANLSTWKYLEQSVGIEPTFSVWKTEILILWTTTANALARVARSRARTTPTAQARAVEKQGYY